MKTRFEGQRAKLAQECRAPRGFSLVELLVVMAIMGILAAIGLPRLESFRFRADANVRLVRMSLQQAQRLSLQQQHDVIVSFDVAGGRIRIAEDTDNNKTVGANEPVTWRGLTEGGQFFVPAAGINGTVSTSVNGANLTTLSGMPTITFHRSGSASSDLEVYLRVTGRKTDAVRGVTLIQSTGRTGWFKYTGSTWKAGGL